jgi:hypothetical protein
VKALVHATNLILIKLSILIIVACYSYDKSFSCFIKRKRKKKEGNERLRHIKKKRKMTEAGIRVFFILKSTTQEDAYL